MLVLAEHLSLSSREAIGRNSALSKHTLQALTQFQLLEQPDQLQLTKQAYNLQGSQVRCDTSPLCSQPVALCWSHCSAGLSGLLVQLLPQPHCYAVSSASVQGKCDHLELWLIAPHSPMRDALMKLAVGCYNACAPHFSCCAHIALIVRQSAASDCFTRLAVSHTFAARPALLLINACAPAAIK